VKVLLATLAIEPESRNENNRSTPYSLGIAYLHASLERSGHQVEALYLNNVEYPDSEWEFFRRFEEFRPDVVGLQVFSMNRVSTFAAIEKLHALSPDTRIVLGGIHASLMYAQILEKFPFVVIVVGEGELTLTELLSRMEGRLPISDVHGLAYYEEGRIRTTPERPLLENLDSLPEPKHEVVFDREPTRYMGHIIASRGCPFDCSFCCLKAISKRRCRVRSVEKVVAEITNLKKRYPRLREVQFHDDTLLLDNKRVIELCRALIKADLGLRFSCSARVKPVSDEMFSWMQRAGFQKIMFGLETGSPKLLHSIHKKITREDVLELFRVLTPYDFSITTFLMCGFPGEDAATIEETIALVRATQRIKYNLIAGIGKLLVYPGTEVYRVMADSGKINDAFWLSDAPVPYFTVEHSLPQLRVFEKRLMDNLSLFNIFTLKGFFLHFMRMPLVIVKEFLRPRNRGLFLSIVAASAQRAFPRAYSLAYAGYLRALSRGGN